MDRFFFDLLDGDDVETDEDGVELPGATAARAQAVRTVAAMMRDDAGPKGTAITMLVRNARTPLFTVRGAIAVMPA